ncbi:glycoside hydrolase family 28 protein [Niabella terrae]
MYHLGFFLSWLLCFQQAAAGSLTAPGDSIPSRQQVGAAAMPAAIAPIRAPFDMPQLQRPVFPDYTLQVDPKDRDAKGWATAAIQSAIDAVHQHGGGKVILPKGDWKSGRIHLKSHVNLEIAAGASLFFSGEIEDYRPAVFTRNEGIELMSLGACIYANGQQHIAITGKGRLIGPALGGSVRRQIMTKDVIENVISFKTPVAERIYEGRDGAFIFPPMFISPINCSNVLIEGIQLEQTAFWNIVPVYCDSVIIRGVTIHSIGIPRGDGIDISSSRNVLIEYCTLSTGDDAFTIKAGRGDDGLRVNRPSENIVVRNGLVLEGHGGITCGSETAAMIRNLSVQNCVFENTRSAIRFKTRRPRGGGGENLYYENIRISGAKYAFEWDMLGSAVHVGQAAARYPPRPRNHLTPLFRNIKAHRISVSQSEQLFKAVAIPESPLENVMISGLVSETKKLISASDLDGLQLTDARLLTDSADIRLLDSRNIRFKNVRFLSATPLRVLTEGPLTGGIRFIKCHPKKPQGWSRKSLPSKTD